MTILNGQRIRALRLERGFSQREVARRIGVTVIVVNGIEDGRNHLELTLRLVSDLAVALDVEAAELFAKAPSAELSEEPRSDLRKLGAVFASERNGIHRDAIARVLDWPLDRVEKASDQLRQRLPALGMRLERGSSGWKLRPDLTALNWQDDVKLGKERQRSRCLKPREAVLLRAALDAPLSWKWEKNIGNADRVALGGLLKTGLLVKTEEGFAASEQAVRSMRSWRLESDRASCAAQGRG